MYIMCVPIGIIEIGGYSYILHVSLYILIVKMPPFEAVSRHNYSRLMQAQILVRAIIIIDWIGAPECILFSLIGVQYTSDDGRTQKDCVPIHTTTADARSVLLLFFLRLTRQFVSIRTS